MKDFSIISEGVLSDIDSTLKASDKASKKIKEQEDIRKYLYLIGSLWNKTYNRVKHNHDLFGRELKLGDVVFMLEFGPDMGSFGIVTHIGDGAVFTDHIRIAVRDHVNTPSEKVTEYDTFNDCMSFWKPENKIILLARKKDAERLLRIIEKTF